MRKGLGAAVSDEEGTDERLYRTLRLAALFLHNDKTEPLTLDDLDTAARWIERLVSDEILRADLELQSLL